MFLIETIKQWKENRAYRKRVSALLEKKKEARNACKIDALLFFTVGAVATFILSGLLIMIVSANITIYQHGGEFLSTLNTVAIILNMSMYLMLIYGIVVSALYTLNNAKIYFKCVFIRVEEYDLNYVPNFRI